MIPTTSPKLIALASGRNEAVLFKDGDEYIIPLYQRAFAWEEKHIVQLIDDICDANGNYYLGTLIVFRKDNRDNGGALFEVIDGQQRLTALFLLLTYLGEKIPAAALSFACRDKSNYTLEHIDSIVRYGADAIVDDGRTEYSILSGLHIIQDFLGQNKEKIETLKAHLRNIYIYRIEVPPHTDLNHYFEVMNTRGEQLEQHDIIKARLLGYIKDSREREAYADIWEACRDMDSYVQKSFTPAVREFLFGYDWNTMPTENRLPSAISKMTEEGERKMIDENVEDKSRRFESIIDFPYFLIHSLKVYIKIHQIQNAEEPERPIMESLMNDKKLVRYFDDVVDKGVCDSLPIKDSKDNFAKAFLLHLLQTRFLFDKYIIKREFLGDDQEGKWSLLEFRRSSKYSHYYRDTWFLYKNEWSSLHTERHPRTLMIQSALRVSYTSPKVMHWITELLTWLLEDEHFENKFPALYTIAEGIAKQATEEGYKPAAGTNTPHIVFNYLDYLIWKKDQVKAERDQHFKDFIFEFRNSVEHWYPRNPSEDTFAQWDEVDRFGNLCLVRRDINSKFSNLSPDAKKATFKDMIAKGSLKLRLMSDSTHTSDLWRSGQDISDGDCAKHEKEMISLLESEGLVLKK